MSRYDNPNEIKVEIPVKFEEIVEATVLMDDVIDSINELNIRIRWNYIAKLFNQITLKEIGELTEEQKKIILSYLETQSDRFKS